jgi:hypothetical protein
MPHVAARAFPRTEFGMTPPASATNSTSPPKRARVAIVAAALALAACHPPRSPREVAQGNVTGTWTAESAAIGEPQDSGHVAWRLTLQEHAAGKVDGRGTAHHGTKSTAFVLTGHRGEDEVTLEWDLLGAPVKYHGAIMGARTMVGEMQMAHDTLHVTLTRK